MEASHALQVYIKASSYNDKDLADMVVNKAAESPLVLLSADDWGSLTIPTLMTLVRRVAASSFALVLTPEAWQVQHQHARIRQLISAMPCQIHGQSSWGSARPASRMPCPLGPLEKIFPVIGPDWQNEYIPWPEQQWGSWGHEASFEDT